MVRLRSGCAPALLVALVGLVWPTSASAEQTKTGGQKAKATVQQGNSVNKSAGNQQGKQQQKKQGNGGGLMDAITDIANLLPKVAGHKGEVKALEKILEELLAMLTKHHHHHKHHHKGAMGKGMQLAKQPNGNNQTGGDTPVSANQGTKKNQTGNHGQAKKGCMKLAQSTGGKVGSGNRNANQGNKNANNGAANNPANAIARIQNNAAGKTNNQARTANPGNNQLATIQASAKNAKIASKNGLAAGSRNAGARVASSQRGVHMIGAHATHRKT